jgi:uncharacterized RDD family membrane protein YckC
MAIISHYFSCLYLSVSFRKPYGRADSGKKTLKIRVVKIDGYQASFGDYMIRWVFRIIDTLFVGVVGIFP